MNRLFICPVGVGSQFLKLETYLVEFGTDPVGLVRFPSKPIFFSFHLFLEKTNLSKTSPNLQQKQIIVTAK